MAKKVAAARAIALGSPYLRESLFDHLIIFEISLTITQP